jgi:DNA-binding MarR family transcriptional regulator
MAEQKNALIESFFRLSMKLSNLMSHPSKFGTDNLLYASEIHTVEMIGKYPGITITELAEQQGISKSAFPKIIHKLIQKGMVYRYQEANNKKNILLKLTEKGLIAFQEHLEFHKTFDAHIMKKIDSLTLEEYLFLSNMLKELEQFVDSKAEQEE